MSFQDHPGVAVEGGTLAVGCAGPAEGPVVLCLHGISSSHLAWARVARELDRLRPGARLVAPDARGRGRSDAIAGPYGLERNVEDALAVLDAVGAERAVVAGHSMGAWVAMRLAAEHPERVTAAVLVDGGTPVTPRPGITLESVLGPAVERLRREFADEEEYVAFWRSHPAFSGGRFNADVEASARYDLAGEPPRLRPRAREEAVRADFVDLLGETGREAHVPLWLVRAGRGLLDQPEPFLSDESVEAFRQGHPDAVVRQLAAANHYTVTLGEGAGDVAVAMSEALA